MENIRYTLGLDIGIASVGWAVLRDNEEGEPYRIERLGVRIFDRAEQPKTGASLAEPRREARSARRTIRRRRHRKERIRHLIAENGLMTQEEMSALFENSSFESSVYELRVEALDRAMNNNEAVRLLLHFAQRRGYKSNSKASEGKDKDNMVVYAAIKENRAAMQEHGYRTFGEMLLKDERFSITLPDGRRVFVPHNKAADYKVTAERAMLEEELHTIFTAQRAFGAAWANEAFESAYMDIWSSQRNFDEGPGGNSPYAGQQITPGKCTFEKDEERAPKASYSAEYFRLLQDLNKMRIVDIEGNAVPLTEEQRTIARDAVMKSATLSYAKLRAKLNLPEDSYFNGLHYGNNEKEVAEKKALGYMKFYHELNAALKKVDKDLPASLTWEQRDTIARVLTLYKSDDKRMEALRAAGIPEEALPCLLRLSPAKFLHLSVKALRKILPHLENGLRYDEACANVYGSHTQQPEQSRKNRLRMEDAGKIANPVVRRAVSQSVKVINAIVRTYGAPERVRVELAREIGKTLAQRTEITNRQNKNAAVNESAKNAIKEIKGFDVTGAGHRQIQAV